MAVRSRMRVDRGTIHSLSLSPPLHRDFFNGLGRYGNPFQNSRGLTFPGGPYLLVVRQFTVIEPLSPSIVARVRPWAPSFVATPYRNGSSSTARPMPPS